METLRVLDLLNTKVSTELQGELLEEARNTAMHAIDYYLSTYSAASEGQTRYENMMLQSQAQLSALLLHKIGARYRELGKERDDESLVDEGNEMIMRSSQVLKLTRDIE
jgi:hypothetical protein